MVARLERDVRRRAGDVVPARARDAQRLDLRVRLAAAMVPTFAERLARADEDAADRRIRRRVGDRARGELAGTREVRRVRVYCVTWTPFQNATYPVMLFAASFVCG